MIIVPKSCEIEHNLPSHWTRSVYYLEKLDSVVYLLVREQSFRQWQVYGEYYYWKTWSKNAGAFQRVINGTLSSGEFSKSPAKEMENVGPHSASGFIDQWVYCRNRAFQVVASSASCIGKALCTNGSIAPRVRGVRFFVARFCSPSPELHETGTIRKHWNGATKYAKPRTVHELVSKIHVLVCGLKNCSNWSCPCRLSCSCAGVLKMLGWFFRFQHLCRAF